jgi:hypothetical protein
MRSRAALFFETGRPMEVVDVACTRLGLRDPDDQTGLASSPPCTQNCPTSPSPNTTIVEPTLALAAKRTAHGR